MNKKKTYALHEQTCCIDEMIMSYIFFSDLNGFALSGKAAFIGCAQIPLQLLCLDISARHPTHGQNQSPSDGEERIQCGPSCWCTGISLDCFYKSVSQCLPGVIPRSTTLFPCALGFQRQSLPSWTSSWSIPWIFLQMVLKFCVKKCIPVANCISCLHYAVTLPYSHTGVADTRDASS